MKAVVCAWGGGVVGFLFCFFLSSKAEDVRSVLLCKLLETSPDHFRQK